MLEQRLEQGMVFTEYERIQKKRLMDGECSIARLPENAERNRFQDVLPYDDTRVELVPTKENNTGYINASHIKVRETLWEKNVPVHVVTKNAFGYQFWFGKMSDNPCISLSLFPLQRFLWGKQEPAFLITYNEGLIIGGIFYIFLQC